MKNRGYSGARRVVAGLFVVAGAFILASCTGQDYAARLNNQSPVPFYSIEYTSGNRSGTIANNSIGALGVPQVPKPVDVDGDSIPDIDVALNIVDASTVLADVPAGKYVVPNLTFQRSVAAVNKPTPPVKIEVVISLPGPPPLNIRFGYDTRRGGSIPTSLKASLLGYEAGFKPFGAIIDTATPLSTGGGGGYDGPLALIGALQSGADKLGLDMNFSPLPRTFRVDYSEDVIPAGDLEGGTRHIKYTDMTAWPAGADPSVDLDAKVTIGKTTLPDPTTTVDATIERLAPQTELHLDLRGANNSVDYKGVTNQAAPDAAVTVVGKEGNKNDDIRLDLSAVPETVRAEWKTAGEELTHALVTASGEGIGAASARIANFVDSDLSDSTPFVPFRPDNRMFAELRQNQSGDSLVNARVESLRRFSLDQVGKETHIGLDANDGLPMRVKIESDLRHQDKPRIDADLITSGLNRGTVLKLLETTDTRPVNLEYSAPTGISKNIDIAGTIDVRGAATGTGMPACGSVEVMCARIDAKRLPSHVLARIDRLPSTHGSDLRLLLDADGTGLANAAPPDLVAHVITPPAENGRPTVLDAALKGMPKYTRARIVDGESGGPERIELHPCRLTDPTGSTCDAGTAGTIGAVEVEVRDGFGQPGRAFELPVTSPNHLVIITRGDRDDDEMNSRVVARAAQVNRLSVLQRYGLLGVDSRLGGGQALSVDVEERAVDRPDDGRGSLNAGQHIVVPALPASIQVCLGDADRDYDDQISDPLTVRCEGTDPFDDGTALDKSPMTFSYDASGPAAVKALLSVVQGSDSEGTDDDRTESTEIAVENAPTALRAAVLAEPTADEQTAVRSLVRLPNDDAAATIVKATVRDVAKLSSCDADAAADGDALCADVSLTGLPKAMSVLFDPSRDNASGEVHACTWRVDSDGSGECRPGTQGTIGRVTADLKQMRPGENTSHALPDVIRPVLPPVNPPPRPPEGCVLCPPEPPREVIDDAFAALVMVENKTEGLGTRAVLDVGSIEHVRFARDAEDLVLTTDMGDVYQRLALQALIDSTVGKNDGETMSASGLVDPLPRDMEVRITAPNDAEDDPIEFHYEASEPIDVDGKIEIRPNGAGRSCASERVVCAEFGLDDVPEEVDVRLVRTTESLDNSAERRRIAVEIDHDGSTKPDLSALVRMGPTDKSPTPLEVRGALTDLPAFTRVRLTQLKEHVGKAQESDRLERLTLHACDAGENGSCPADATGSIHEASVSARTFTSRPSNFPARPTLPDAGAWITRARQQS